MSIRRTFVTVWVCLGLLTQTTGLSRIPLARQLPRGLPLDGASVQLSSDASVRYDRTREVYIFSYKRFGGQTVPMGFELATKVDVIVEGTVDLVQKGRGLRYSYALRSLPTSKQAANWFAITTDHPVQAAGSPDNGWSVWIPPKPERIFQGKPGVAWSDSRIRPGVPPPPLPVFSDEMAQPWWNAKGNESLPVPSLPSVRPAQTGLAPGKFVEGFTFVSTGLPGIGRCYARGAQFMPVTHGEPPPEIERLTFDNSFLFVEGKTVVPALENPPRDPIQVLDQLMAWVREAGQLGWVGQRELLEQIVSRLTKARRHWAAAKQSQAAQELDAISAIAEREKGVNITSELYAILKFNSEALRKLVSGETNSVVSDDLTVKLSKHVTNYNLGVFNFLEALIRVSNDFQIPMGIVWVNSPAERAELPFAWKDATVREIIESIAQTQPGYRVQVKNGVVHVSPPALVPDRQNFLKLKVEAFEVHDEVEVASWKLHTLVTPIRGSYQISIGATGDSKVDVELKDSTVENILDALVVASNRKIWVVTLADDTGLTARGFRRTRSLWTDAPIPDEQQPAWDLLRWGDPMPRPAPGAK